MRIIYSKISVVLQMNHGRSKLSTSIMMIRALKTKTRRRSLFENFTNTNKSVSKRRCLCLVSERYWIHQSLNVNKMADKIRKEQSTNNCSNITNASTNTLYIYSTVPKLTLIGICGPSTYAIQPMDIRWSVVLYGNTRNLQTYEIFERCIVII